MTIHSYQCPYCGKEFGTPRIRDRHAAACAETVRDAEAARQERREAGGSLPATRPAVTFVELIRRAAAERGGR